MTAFARAACPARRRKAPAGLRRPSRPMQRRLWTQTNPRLHWRETGRKRVERMAQPASARKRATRPARGASPSRPRQRRFHAQTKPRLRWRGCAAPPGRGRQLRMKVSRGQQPIAEGDGGARGATPRLRTWPGGARMPGARAASPGGTREGRSGGDQGTPRPGDPEFKLRPPGARPRTWPNNCCKARGQRQLLEYSPIIAARRGDNASCWNIP